MKLLPSCFEIVGREDYGISAAQTQGSAGRRLPSKHARPQGRRGQGFNRRRGSRARCRPSTNSRCLLRPSVLGDRRRLDRPPLRTNPANHNGLKLMLGHLPPSEEDLEKLQAISKEPPPPGRTRSPVPDPATASVCRLDHRTLAASSRRQTGTCRPRRRQRRLGGPCSESFHETRQRSASAFFARSTAEFPNRLPDCARPSNLTELSRRTKETGADLGIAWDGDGDRVAFADSSGEVATADEISLLLARNQLSKRPNEKVVWRHKSCPISFDGR